MGTETLVGTKGPKRCYQNTNRQQFPRGRIVSYDAFVAQAIKCFAVGDLIVKSSETLDVLAFVELAEQRKTKNTKRTMVSRFQFEEVLNAASK